MIRSQLLVLLIFVSPIIFAQDKFIIISGIVMDADSIGAVPYVNIRKKETYFGTVADNSGHFAFTAQENDTLHFSSIGYLDAYFIMPERLDGDTYTLIQLMRKETVLLEEVIVFPWPDFEQLKTAFLSTKPQRDMNDVTFETKRKIKQISEDEYSRNKNYYNVYRNNQLYNMTGIIAPNDFLNPIEWSNFIRDIKNKKYK